MIKLSVFIIAKNEADRIASAIKAVQTIADEIIVVDSGSTDQTRDIATNLGAKFIFNQWSGYGQQKIFAQSQCKNSWVLNIDADEEVSAMLAAEIKKILSKPIAASVAGYRIKIFNQFPLETIPSRFAYYYNQLRLYNKNLASFKDSSVHDSVVAKEGMVVEQLKNLIHHRSFRSIAHWIEKINSYSSMQAEEFLSRKKTLSFARARILLTPLLAFFKAYFVRRYFIYGLNGIIYSAIYAFSRFAKIVKIRELILRNRSKGASGGQYVSYDFEQPLKNLHLRTNKIDSAHQSHADKS